MYTSIKLVKKLNLKVNMPKFLITNTYKYTQTLEVNAPDKTTALEMAALLDDEFLHNNDDWVYDQEIKELK